MTCVLAQPNDLDHWLNDLNACRYIDRQFRTYLYSGHIGEVTPNIEFSSHIQPDTHANGIVAFDKTKAQMPADSSIAKDLPILWAYR